MTAYIRNILTGLVVLIGLCVPACLTAQTPATVEVRPLDSTASGPLLLIDGKLATVDSIEMAVRGQQVMIWIRELEKLGWGVVEPGNAPEKTIFKSGSITLTFTKNSDAAMVNSLNVQLPIETYLRGGRLMVPLSFVSKSLGYSYDMSQRPVANVQTTVAPAPVKANELKGRALYRGKGVEGIKVSLVDPEYNTIKGFLATTDSDGNYAFDSLPDGKYLAYVWVGHNADYFNRVSEQADLSGGKAIELKPIILGKIVHPIRPKEEQTIAAASKYIFEWTPCEGAASYKLVITRQGGQEELVSVTTSQTKAEVVSAKLTAGHTYAADIEARDSEGRFLGGTVGAGGTLWTFTIAAKPQP